MVYSGYSQHTFWADQHVGFSSWYHFIIKNEDGRKTQMYTLEIISILSISHAMSSFIPVMFCIMSRGRAQCDADTMMTFMETLVQVLHYAMTSPQLPFHSCATSTGAPEHVQQSVL